MEFSRRWFLKTALAAVAVSQLPLTEGHRVLFIDGSPLHVTRYVFKDGLIHAKVVNGLWDLVLDTKKKMQYAYCNSSYGCDAPHMVTGKLVTSGSYEHLVEVIVPKYLGEVPEELKPKKVQIGKFEEHEELAFENGWPVLDAEGKPVMKIVYKPVMVKKMRTYPPSEYGQTSFTYIWEQDTYEITSDPLNGAGLNYNAVIEAAERMV